MVIENGGIIVCRTKHLALAGGGKVKNNRTFSLLALSSNRDQLCLGGGGVGGVKCMWRMDGEENSQGKGIFLMRPFLTIK